MNKRMENRAWRKKRSPERAIINSDGQRPSEKNTVSFQSRLKACHPTEGNVFFRTRLELSPEKRRPKVFKINNPQ
jgi:hypothetical protein